MSTKGSKSGFGGRKSAAPMPAAAGSTPRVDLAEFERETIDAAQKAGALRYINKSLIDPDPENPRQSFDPKGIEELADSIEAHGLMQPLIVRAVEGGRYQIITGERRWRAYMSRASLKDVWVAINNDVAPFDILIMQIHENEQRESVNPMDTARAYARVVAKVGSQRAAVELIRKDETIISRYMSLLNAPPEVQELSSKITDVVTLSLVSRLVKQDPVEGRDVIDRIYDGSLKAGTVRRAVETVMRDKKAGRKTSLDKTAGANPAAAGTAAPGANARKRQILLAEQVHWIVEDDESKHLVVLAGGVEYEVRLPEGKSWETIR